MSKVLFISSMFLSAVFLFAGIDKLVHYDGFVNALRNYALMPTAIAQYVTLPVIFSELWIGLGLLVKSWRKPASLVAAIILAIFTAALFVNYLHTPESVCGCLFTITLGRANALHLIQNLFMLGLAIMVWWDCRRKERETALFNAVPTGPQ